MAKLLINYVCILEDSDSGTPATSRFSLTASLRERSAD